MKKQLIFLTLIFLLLPSLQAQDNLSRKAVKQRHSAIRAGNKELKGGRISSAITHYRDALKADTNSVRAQFNMGCAFAKRNQADSALVCYSKVTRNQHASASDKARAHYNAGNIYLKKALAARDSGSYDPQSLNAAIEQYKSALRLDGNNQKAKHNLSLAKKLIRPQQNNQNQNKNQNQQQNQQNKDQQNKDQQNKDQQNKDQQHKDQQNKEQQNKQKPNEDKQNQKQKEQRRREAEQMLNAMKNNEQQTMRAVRMKEMNKERQKGNPNRIEKDW